MLVIVQIIKIEQKSIYRFTVLSSRHFVGNDLGSFLKYSGKKDFYAINIGSILPRHKYSVLYTLKSKMK